MTADGTVSTEREQNYISDKIYASQQEDVSFELFHITIYFQQVVDSYATDEIGRIYRNNKWEQEKKVFKDYGPGVRRVSLQSAGKDDKYWGGHYGALMSASTVRVKREAKTAEGDDL